MCTTTWPSSRERFLRISAVLAAAALLPVALLACYGQEVFIFLLGPQWQMAGHMAEVLVFSVALYFVFSPTSSVLIILGRQGLLLTFAIVQLVYRAGAAYLSDSVQDYVRMLMLFEAANVVAFVLVVIHVLGRAANRPRAIGP